MGSHYKAVGQQILMEVYGKLGRLGPGGFTWKKVTLSTSFG